MINRYLKKLEHHPVIYIKPTDLINKHSLNKHEFDLNGDWDKLGSHITTGFIFRSFAQRLKGIPWEDTLLYKRKRRLGQRWLKKLPIWDSMLDDIVSNGYTQQPNTDPIDEYISILIGRDGHMFIYNGIHRLCCCLLSKKVDHIPVKVILRHTEWAKFKQSCKAYADRRNGLYAQIPHPDLEHIMYNWTNERAELIAKNSNYPNGTVVDLGSHWGTSSYILAQHGFKVTAIERSKNHFNKLTKISNLPGKSFNRMKGDFTLYDFDIDTLVALNIFHHFIIDKQKRKVLRNFLLANTCKEIFYQSHKEDDKWSPYMKPVEMREMIMECTNKTTYKELANFNGRRLYHLT